MRIPASLATLAAICMTSAAIVAAQNSVVGATPPAHGTCIAIALPTVQGASGSALDVATAVRELFGTYLQGPAIRVVSLEAKLSLQAREEARQKSCDRLLTISLVHKRSGGGSLGRALGNAGSAAAWHAPVSGIGAAVTRSAVIAGGHAVSEIASSTRARDEIRLEYTLISPDGRSLMKPVTEAAQASVDGEDLLTPLVHRAAESIAAFVLQP